MAIKPALCRADQSSSFGHSRLPTRTHITVYDTQLHNTDPCPHTQHVTAHKNHAKLYLAIPSYYALNHDT